MRYFLVLFIFSSIAACSNVNSTWRTERQLSTEELLDEKNFLRQESLTDAQRLIDAEAKLRQENPLSITSEMKAFVDYFAPSSLRSSERADELVRGMFSHGGLGLEYVTHANYSAIEAFNYGQANCLSFTLLFYALAEYAGLPISIYEVEIPNSWDMSEDGRLVTYMHMNAKVATGRRTQIVDVNIDNYDDKYYKRRISVSEALAHYFNNLAVEAMLKGRPVEAFAAYRIALEHNPEGGYIWGNLGALYKSRGDFESAKHALHYGLEFDGFQQVIASNLSRVEFRLGNLAESERLEKLVRNFRNDNPYYLFAMSKNHLSSEDYEMAQKLISRAKRLVPDEYRFYHLSAQINYALGDNLAVKEDLSMAFKLAKKFGEKERFSRKLQSLEG